MVLSEAARIKRLLAAADNHDKAALRHDAAAQRWHDRGGMEQAALERRGAEIERDAAQLDRDRAEFHGRGADTLRPAGPAGRTSLP